MFNSTSQQSRSWGLAELGNIGRWFQILPRIFFKCCPILSCISLFGFVYNCQILPKSVLSLMFQCFFQGFFIRCFEQWAAQEVMLSLSVYVRLCMCVSVPFFFFSRKNFYDCLMEVSKVFQGRLRGVQSSEGPLREIQVQRVFQVSFKNFMGVSKTFQWSSLLQFCCCMALIAATRAEGGLVL